MGPRSNRVALAAAIATAVLLSAQPAQAQSALTEDLMADLVQVEEKLLGLANAMSADQYGWRPGEGVRSVSGVFQHVAADNFLLAAPFLEVPAWTKMDASDYSTVQAFETREIDRDQVISELEQSFAHIKAALETMTDAKYAESVSLFGREWTAQKLWVLTLGHAHEHLGQSIAYARSNGVVPPWSR